MNWQRCLILAVFVAAVPIVQAALASSGEQARIVRASKGANVLAQIRPSDTAIRVLSGQSEPLFVLPPQGTTLVQWLTDFSQSVWRIRISHKQGRLNEAGDFLETDVTATVLETLKESPNYAVPASGTIEFTWMGGEMISNGVKIDAVVPWLRQPEVGHTYLAFGKVIEKPEVGWLWEETPSGYVTTLNGRPPELQLLHGSSVPETVQAVRAAALKKR